VARRLPEAARVRVVLSVGFSCSEGAVWLTKRGYFCKWVLVVH
jgi:hypothetical protein